MISIRTMNDELKKCESCGGSCGNCSNQSKACQCTHHKVIPVMIILIAVTFLLNAFNYLADQSTAVIWPILLLIAGGTKLGQSKCGCC